ncbi:GlxA family transcriptional regulator [Amantichitinum ursilacus]|uniref:HTH-type transcriptional regulator CdhR n=1 Tax=Amantichitinum ursilacus TaxID=857265 RepID=A0A0N0XKL6_9NEIS|nr:helix-turn-helix domain-containing protein [Amantichitinum ursilacus]KPC54267.1 HTH-type transcriptional regulator CdhR [Amantichitinum ursilacus]
MQAVPARRIVIVVYHNVNVLDVAGPLEAFSQSVRMRPELPPFYQLTVASPQGGAVMTSAGLPLHTVALADIDPLGIDTVLVPGGAIGNHVPDDVALIAWVRQHQHHWRRLCSVCTGAFLLAAADVLGDAAVTTHWDHLAQLRGLYPQLDVRDEPIFLQQGRIWTSAGISAGIDLALALIEQDRGHAIAMEVAQRLVVFLKRPGNQAQFSAPLLAQQRSRAGFAELHGWISAHLTADLRVEQLAARAGMSVRSFCRAYQEQQGTTPARMVETLRLEAACRALQQPRASIKRVAADAGFGDEQNLRRAFLRRLGVLPQDYRERFCAATAGPATPTAAAMPA